MTEDRISAPVTRVDTPHDRPSDTSHYQAIERARDGGRRQPRHGRPQRPPAPARVARADPGPPPDTLRGRHVDVIV